MTNRLEFGSVYASYRRPLAGVVITLGGAGGSMGSR
jgi:hypothetical protein